ncbi:unnamed protein product [Trichogramma brassicae]|uniref:Uncharacterized protein n=1 Tax=Trichogramma brassicae TaxID=86971 RepID=A0A6H5IXD9_9HYME|nr:unnamed protein product [Trichogramma brassicae]
MRDPRHDRDRFFKITFLIEHDDVFTKLRIGASRKFFRVSSARVDTPKSSDDDERGPPVELTARTDKSTCGLSSDLSCCCRDSYYGAAANTTAAALWRGGRAGRAARYIVRLRCVCCRCYIIYGATLSDYAATSLRTTTIVSVYIYIYSKWCSSGSTVTAPSLLAASIVFISCCHYSARSYYHYCYNDHTYMIHLRASTTTTAIYYAHSNDIAYI